MSSEVINCSTESPIPWSPSIRTLATTKFSTEWRIAHNRTDVYAAIGLAVAYDLNEQRTGTKLSFYEYLAIIVPY